VSRSATQAVKFANISATTAAFELKGGLYQVSVVATWNSTGTVTIEQLGPDGATWLTVHVAFSANGGDTIFLPPGQYRFEIATATAVYASVVTVPEQ
jgi:hypothetical protein